MIPNCQGSQREIQVACRQTSPLSACPTCLMLCPEGMRDEVLPAISVNEDATVISGCSPLM